VVLIVGEHNLRSQRAVEKLGTRREKLERRPGRDGIERTNVVFVLTRADLPRVEAMCAEASRG
jgi:RimJ/RimL family protein N-acetyltransferase